MTTPNGPHIVRITFASGRPLATPAVVKPRQGETVEFEGTGEAAGFELDFHEAPESGPRERFRAVGGKVSIRIKNLDPDKYPPGSPESKWKKIKYDVVVNGVRLDPDVIIDPN